MSARDNLIQWQGHAFDRSDVVAIGPAEEIDAGLRRQAVRVVVNLRGGVVINSEVTSTRRQTTDAIVAEMTAAANASRDDLINLVWPPERPAQQIDRRAWECECCGHLMLTHLQDDGSRYQCPACKISECDHGGKYSEIPVSRLLNEVAGQPESRQDLFGYPEQLPTAHKHTGVDATRIEIE